MQYHDNNTITQNHINIVRLFSFGLLLTLLSLPVLSQPLGSSGQPPEAYLNRLAERLELSPQQRTDIKTIMSSGKIAAKPTQDAIQANRAALKSVINSDSPDQAQIQSLAQTQGELVTESVLQKAAVNQQINALLSADQRIKMQAYKDARRDMQKPRKHRRARAKQK